MQRLTGSLKGYSGPNPFAEAQGRTFSDSKVKSEFFTTSTFLSRLNAQHEILLGTRGSGKTFLLRMLSYSLFRTLRHEELRQCQRARSFIGFYVALHLEFIGSLTRPGIDDSRRREYFQFGFNCSAAISFIGEVLTLLSDIFWDPTKRLIAENNISERLMRFWFTEKTDSVSSLAEVIDLIEECFATQPFWVDGERQDLPILAGPILIPIRNVLRVVSLELGLDPEQTHWIACIDEAEFLSDPFIECINTFLRSDKRPLVVKMATLPFRHTTLATLQPGISIEPDGHDFNYRQVDLLWSSEDFVGFTNRVTSLRLARAGARAESLEDFLGSGDEHGVDRFRAELGPDEASKERIAGEILSALSPARRRRYETLADDPEKIASQYTRKFAPVLYVRRMRAEERRANRQVGWFSGARMVRQVADGNPRRFIQIMNELFERATVTDLDAKEQHRSICSFAKRALESVQGLPDYGPLVHSIIEHVGALLARHVHGPEMRDSGCGFYVSEHLLRDPLVYRALTLGVDYSNLMTDDPLNVQITPNTQLRISFIYAVVFWLPMRLGDRFVLREQHRPSQLSLWQEKLTRTRSQELLASLQLALIGEEDANATSND